MQTLSENQEGEILHNTDKNKINEFEALRESYLNEILIKTLGTNLEKEINADLFGGYV